MCGIRYVVRHHSLKIKKSIKYNYNKSVMFPHHRLVQKGLNAEDQDQTCKTTRSTFARKNPLKNPKDEVWIKRKFGHTPRNIGITELKLCKLWKGSRRITKRK